ncbi:MAG: PEP-CTERM sorting domain-containing protein [Phycisphaeraceae bacterium]
MIARPFAVGTAMTNAMLLAVLSTPPAHARTHWEGSSDNDWSNAASWSDGVPGNFPDTLANTDPLFSARLGPSTQTINFDVSASPVSMDFEDFDLGTAFIIVNLDATFFGQSGTLLDVGSMTFSPSFAGPVQGIVGVNFNRMDIRTNRLVVDNDFLGLGPRGKVELTLQNNTDLTVVNAGTNGIDPNAPVLMENTRLEIRSFSVLTNVELGGNTSDQEPLILGEGSELHLNRGGELGWSTITTDGAPLIVGFDGGLITADFIHPGTIDLQDDFLTFGAPDPFFPPPPDPGTNVDRDPNAGNDLVGFLAGAVSGPGGIAVDHPRYTVVATASNSFSGGIKLLQGRFKATSGPATGSLSNFFQFENGTYEPDGSYNSALPMEFLAGGTGVIDTPDFDHTVKGDWTGSGDFRKTGEKTLTLDRDGTGFNGDYIVSEGTLLIPRADAVDFNNDLIIEAGATARFATTTKMEGLWGEGTLQIDSGKTAQFNGLGVADPATAADFAGNVAGAGTIEVNGLVSAQRFSGDNAGFAGTWLATSGITIFSSVQAVPDTVTFGSGLVILDQGGTHTGTLIGSNGVFEKAGDNTLILEGEYGNFTGTTRVENGTLILDQPSFYQSDIFIGSTQIPGATPAGGTLRGSVGNTIRRTSGAIHVMDGGTLTGQLIASDVHVYDGGVFAPDHDPNDLGVRSNFSLDNLILDPGGVLEIGVTRVQGFADSNIVFADGTATLGGTLRIIMDADHPAAPADTYFVLFTQAAIGQFENVSIGQRVTTAGGEGSFLLEKIQQAGTGDDILQLVNFLPALPGDTDVDGDIDDADLGTAFSNYTGPIGAAGGKTFADGDTDNDGDVDDTDLGTSFSGYTGPLTTANVPEPAGPALLGLGFAAGWRRRRN